MAIQTLTLNVNAQPSAEDRAFLYLSQNENGRDIRFRVLGDDLPSGCTATLSGVKPDGNVWSKAGTVTNNFVVVEEDIQMTAVAGRWDAQLDIVNGSKNIVTALIRITVEAAAVEAGAVPSDTQLEGYVEQCKQYAETAKNEAYGSPLTAATAAAMTDQSRVYVYTGSETGYTAGHWYYHNGTSWTDGGVYNAVAVDTDTTLSVSGKAADAKKTGDEISQIKEDLSDINSEIFIGEADTDPHGITFKSRIDTDGSFVSASSGKYCRTGRMDMSGHIAVSIEAKSGYRIKLFYYSSGDGTPASKYTGSSEGYTTSYSLNGSNLKCLAFAISRLDSGVIDTTLTADDFFTVTFYDSRLDAQEREIENINQFLGRSIKILGIGNSYTRDSLRWVWKILTKCGFENVIVGHGYWGASTLQAQYESIDPTSANHTVYEYWKYTDTQDATKTSGKSLDDIVSDENWDVVVFQQQSDNAGQYNSFVNNDFDINDFVSYVKTNISNPNLRIGIAQTWSHATGYHSTNFDNWYNSDPATQLLAIETVIPQVANHMTQCDMIVKTGEAVKYGRLNQYLGAIGNEMLRSDKNHLDYGIPSFMAGMVYAMTICGIKPCDISWYPTGTDEGQSGITATTFLSYLAKQCALQATMQI